MSAFHWMYAVSLKALKGLRHNACTSSHHVILSHMNQNTPVYDTQAVSKKCCLFFFFKFLLLLLSFFFFFLLFSFFFFFLCSFLNKMLVSGHYAATAGLTRTPALL